MGRSGQKVNPVGWRVGIYRKWKNSWVQNKLNYKDLLLNSINISKLLRSFLRFGKKRRLFFFNYTLLNNNNLDIFCFFTRIKRKKPKFRQKLKKIKKKTKMFQDNLYKYYEKKVKYNYKIKNKAKVKKKSVKVLNIFGRDHKYNVNFVKKKRILKFKYNKDLKSNVKSKFKLNKLALKLREVKLGRNSTNKSNFKLIQKDKKVNSNTILSKKENTLLKKISSKKKKFFHFLYNIEYFGLFFSFNLLNYFNYNKHNFLDNNALLKKLTLDKFFLSSFLLLNRLNNYDLNTLKWKLSNILKKKQIKSYDLKYIDNKLSNKIRINEEKNLSTFVHTKESSANFFLVNKKTREGKLFSNKKQKMKQTKDIINNQKFSSFSFLSKVFDFDKNIYALYFKQSKYIKFTSHQNNLIIYNNKKKISASLFNESQLNNFYVLYSILSTYNFDFLTIKKKSNSYKSIYKSYKKKDKVMKRYKKTLSLFNISKLFFKYNNFKKPLALLKNSLSVLTGYTADVFFSSVNSFYKFSRKKYWDPINFKKLPDYRRSLYLKQSKKKKYDLKKLTFKFYRRIRNRYIQLKNLRFLLRLCMLTSFVKRPIIFARYFCYQINKFPKKYRQIPFLRYVMSIFLTLSKRKEILGARVQIQGRFDKWRRSKIMIKESGILTTRKKFFFIEYGSCSGFIKKGSYGIKVWLSYRPKFSNFYKHCFISYFNYSNLLKKNFINKRRKIKNFFKFRNKSSLLKKKLQSGFRSKKKEYLKSNSKKVFMYNSYREKSKVKVKYKTKFKRNEEKQTFLKKLKKNQFEFRKLKWSKKKNKIDQLLMLPNLLNI